jgi:2,3-bisphosphoglycerate-independent phosphoglycerate mutase
MTRAAGMNVVSVDGATGFDDTNYEGKVKAAISELKNRDIVYLNIAGAEEVSLKGNIDDKILTIEDIDSSVIGPLLKETSQNTDVKMLVVVNHMSSAVDVKYGKERVPFVISSGNKPSSLEKFDENLLSGDGDHFKSGPELINAFFDVN